MILPEAFQKRMQALLQEEYPAFLQSFSMPRSFGLRVNPLRCKPEDFVGMAPFPLTPVPWCPEGFYYPPESRPGKHPYYDAGIYYIQEPSAMAVGAIAAAQPGEWVLDLCAAPGGKTTHLAGQMDGKGVLVANEIHPARAKTLAQTIERCGICNAVVTNEPPERLAAHFQGMFDCVVVDAPCSGEGMFRKEPEAIHEWTENTPDACAVRQDEILDFAVQMLRPGGRLIYSTCTFAPVENEGTITRLLSRNPDLSILPLEGLPWFSAGQPDWYPAAPPAMAGSLRLWPHKLHGEGHFCAKLIRTGQSPARAANKCISEALPPECADFWEYIKPAMPTPMALVRRKDKLWAIPEIMPKLDGLRVLRAGAELGVLKKGRFEPAHALSHILRPATFPQTVSFAPNSIEVQRYLMGETLPVAEHLRGWVLVCTGDFALGWGKASGGVLKNHYPKGLRWLKV